MTPTWQRLEGVVLADRYLLEQCVGESENATLFRTSYGPDARPALLRLIPASATAPEVQLDLWRRVAGLTHPNLLPLFDSGQAEYHREPVLYAVFERPDEILQTALDQEPLAAPEALEILRAVLAALNSLHSQGLVHTAIDARHVVAVGNQIKLWNDAIHPSTRSETPEEDVASLGALLFHVLVGRPIGSSTSPDLSAVPDPFRSIIENTAGKPPGCRWTLSQIAQAVEPRPLPPANSSLPPQSSILRRALPLWAYGALAAVLAGLGFLFLPKSLPPAAPAPPHSTPVQASVNVPPPETLALASPAVPPPTAEPKPPSREAWRVVAYTYSSYADAQRRAKTVNRRWPASKAAVFSPNGVKRPPYLVALGGVMTRDQAVRLLKAARARGLPRDTYIQGYPR